MAALTSLLAVEGLSKSFGSVTALRDVSFSLAAGELRAICGENGAGKSTFVKLLMGLLVPDAGTLKVDGVVRTIRGAKQAQALGLGLVAQELSLAPHLSILDNIWLGSAAVPFVHHRARLRRGAGEALAMLGVGDWDLDRPVGSLSVGHRQIVEIARLLARDARILILDEPTATLSDVEIARLMKVLKAVKQQNRSVIYISHRLGEVFELCDSATVLRNGEHVATAPVAELTRGTLIELMLGRSFQEMYPPAEDNGHGGGLVVENLHVPGAVHSLSLTAPRGRIVSIVGQIGSGATAVTRALAGLIGDVSGQVALDGAAFRLGSVPHAVSRGVLFVTDDRAGEGIFRDMSVLDNLVATRLAAYSRARVVSWPRLRRLARYLAGRVGIDLARLRAQAGDLSGGNQQKLLVARALDRSTPGVLLMNEPTRGIDVGARSEIYRLMRECCAMGYAVVMTSSDLEEVIGMSDTVITLYRGRHVGRYERGEIAMATILGDIIHPATTVGAAV